MVELRQATEDDLPAIGALRESVGWAAHGWALRAAMQPPAAHFLVAVDDGRMVAMGSGMSYGQLGFVGNMVVAPSHRRRGLATDILRRILAFLEERGARCIELEATADGRPLYERHGFTLFGGRVMARVPREAVHPAGAARVRVAAAEDLLALAAYDAPRFGGDRAELLAVAVADPARPLLLAERDGALAGYAWLRADGARLGPWVSDSRQVAADLLAGAFAALPDVPALTTNIADDNGDGVAWLRSLADETGTHDGRMRLGDPAAVDRRPETLYGNAVGALG